MATPTASDARRRPRRLDLTTLAEAFHGELVTPGHPDYDVQRAVWNGAIDRRPAVVARCADVDDVVGVVGFARRSGLELAVRGGGHSFPGLSVVDDGVVLDLSLMRGVDVDPAARTARVEAGVLLGEMDAATQAHGLAVPTGAVTHTGVAGLTLGGGIGWLMRRYGLAIDNLRGARLVTADGRVRHVSAEHDPELFWGLRGGGGNFGVVTEFAFDLHPVGPDVVSGFVLWRMDDAETVTAAYRDWCADAPDELTSALVLRRAPAIDLVPQDLHGEHVVGVLGCWSGDLDDGESYWQPMRAYGRPVADLTARRPFLEHQSMLDAGFPHGQHVYMKASDVRALDDGVLDVLVDHGRRTSSVRSSVIAWQLGGAVREVDADATAFASREAGFIVNITGIAEDPAGLAREQDWVRAFWEDLRPHQTSVYVNFLADADADQVRDAYGPDRFARLQAVKAAYDPGNLFHLNQNVPPA